MKNYKAYIILIGTATLLQACWSTRNSSVAGADNTDTTGLTFNTSGINRSVPPPVNQNQPLGSVGMGPTNALPPVKPVVITSESLLENNLSPSNLNTKPGSNFSFDKLTTEEFFKEISHSYTNMVTIGLLAQQKAENKAIKTLGNDMANYFKSSAQKLKSVAPNQDLITLNTATDDMILDNLKGINGQAFDHMFLETTLNSLQGFIALYERTSTTDDQDLKNYTLKNIPVLKEYLAKALAIKQK